MMYEKLPARRRPARIHGPPKKFFKAKPSPGRRMDIYFAPPWHSGIGSTNPVPADARRLRTRVARGRRESGKLEQPADEMAARPYRGAEIASLTATDLQVRQERERG